MKKVENLENKLAQKDDIIEKLFEKIEAINERLRIVEIEKQEVAACEQTFLKSL